MLNGINILITGETGSFEKQFSVVHYGNVLGSRDNTQWLSPESLRIKLQETKSQEQ